MSHFAFILSMNRFKRMVKLFKWPHFDVRWTRIDEDCCRLTCWMVGWMFNSNSPSHSHSPNQDRNRRLGSRMNRSSKPLLIELIEMSWILECSNSWMIWRERELFYLYTESCQSPSCLVSTGVNCAVDSRTGCSRIKDKTEKKTIWEISYSKEECWVTPCHQW